MTATWSRTDQSPSPTFVSDHNEESHDSRSRAHACDTVGSSVMHCVSQYPATTRLSTVAGNQCDAFKADERTPPSSHRLSLAGCVCPSPSHSLPSMPSTSHDLSSCFIFGLLWSSPVFPSILLPGPPSISFRPYLCTALLLCALRPFPLGSLFRPLLALSLQSAQD